MPSVKNNSVWRAAIALACAASIACVPGCGVMERGDEPTPRLQKSRVQDVQLRDRLYTYSDRFAATIMELCDGIERETQDLSLKRRVIEWKLRAIPAMNSIVGQANPRVAMLDVVTFAVHQRQFVEQDQNREAMGPHHGRVVETARLLEDEAWNLGVGFLTDEEYERWETAVRAWCEARTATSFLGKDRMEGAGDMRAVARPDLIGTSGGGGFLGNVNRELGSTNVQLERITQLVERLSQQAEFSYTYARWSAEILLYEFLDSPEGQRLQANLDGTSNGLDRLAGSVERIEGLIPEDAQDAAARVEAVLAQLEQHQLELSGMLREARGAIAQVEGLVDPASDLAAQAEILTASLAEAGESWQRTATTAERLLAALPTDEDGRVALDPDRLEALVAQAAALAETSERLLVRLDALTGPNELEARLAALEEATGTVFDSADASVSRALRLGALYGAGLVGLIFTGLLVLRLVPRRERPSTPA